MSATFAVARSDYRYGCPNCSCPPRKGDSVVKVGTRWWHSDCRRAYLSARRRAP